MTTPLYELHHVSRHYGERVVLHIEALEVLRGEILAIVGPSGAGKSTLLRLLAFLEPPDSGTLWYRNTPILYPPGPTLQLRREVTLVFQRLALLNRSVLDNVLYGLQVRGVRGREAVARQILEDVGLTAFARHPARQLSGGEMQRMALARALVLRPLVLLLDEPTANLDPANVGSIERLIREANERYSTTIVLVTHNVFQARRLAHRTALLLEGRLVEVTATTTFFEAPTDPRVTAFVNGEMLY